MALTLATNKQVPEHSIMDAYNKQAYLGNQFIAASNSVSLPDTSEHPVLYLANSLSQGPAGTGQAIFNGVRNMSSPAASGVVIFRVYANPTGVSAGTAVTPINCRLSSATTSIATVLISPTVVSKGTLIAAEQYVDNVMLILDAAQSILITAQAVGSAEPVLVEAAWYEL